jgi:hypothetical protein
VLIVRVDVGFFGRFVLRVSIDGSYCFLGIFRLVVESGKLLEFDLYSVAHFRRDDIAQWLGVRVVEIVVVEAIGHVEFRAPEQLAERLALRVGIDTGIEESAVVGILVERLEWRQLGRCLFHRFRATVRRPGGGIILLACCVVLLRLG